MRTLCVVLIVFIVCVAGVGAVRAWGGSAALTLDALFTAPDGSPCPQACLFGVMPGVTTAAQARLLLREHPVTRTFRLISEEPYRLEARGERIVVVSFNPTPDGVVDEITMQSYVRYGRVVGEPLAAIPAAGNLGELMSRFGVPDFLLLTTGGDPLLMFAEQGIAVSLLRGELLGRHLAPRTSINRLTVWRIAPCPADAFEYVFQGWRGLTSLRGYNRAKVLYLMVRRIHSAGTSFAPCG